MNCANCHGFGEIASGGWSGFPRITCDVCGGTGSAIAASRITNLEAQLAETQRELAEARTRVEQYKAEADVPFCFICGGTGVVYETGDFGHVYGSDWCDSCDAGKNARETVEREEARTDKAEQANEALREENERLREAIDTAYDWCAHKEDSQMCEEVLLDALQKETAP